MCIRDRHNIIAATIVSTALFTFMHGGAFEAGIIPVLNVLTMSLLTVSYTHLDVYKRQALPPHFGQKKAGDLFSDFLLGVPLCERRVFSCKSSGQVDPM